jgi:cbb3-type cytochrome oxidase subunit 3
MNIGLVGGIATIVSMAAFLASVIWAMNARRRKDFERTALLPLEEDGQS